MTGKELQTWETMVELGVCTDEELGLAAALCGPSIQTFERVLYIRTGYRSLEQYMDAICGLDDDLDDLDDLDGVDEIRFDQYSGSYYFDC